MSPAETRAGRSWGRVTVKKTLRWLAPKPVAASSVAGSIRRSPGVTMRCAIGARNTDKASHAPTNP